MDGVTVGQNLFTDTATYATINISGLLPPTFIANHRYRHS